MATLKEIQIKLAEAIKQSGITQVELANRLNIHQSNISHYLKCEKTPSLETFAHICSALDLDANEILCL